MLSGIREGLIGIQAESKVVELVHHFQHGAEGGGEGVMQIEVGNYQVAVSYLFFRLMEGHNLQKLVLVFFIGACLFLLIR